MSKNSNIVRQSFTVARTVGKKISTGMADFWINYIPTKAKSILLSEGYVSSTPHWYGAITGNSFLGLSTYTIPILTAMTTYYVACETTTSLQRQ